MLSGTLKKWAFPVLKIVIAVVGLWFVIHNTPWHDEATIQRQTQIRDAVFLEPTRVEVLSERPGVLHVRFGNAKIPLEIGGLKKTVEVNEKTVGIPNETDLPASNFVQLDFKDPSLAGPKLDLGLKRMVGNARKRWWLLVGAWILVGLPFLLTSWRWRILLEPQGVTLPLKKCVELNFVGQFYSTLLPGLTSGDLVKIVYASKMIGSKTKSTITVLLDRAIGLIALMVIGGAAAAFQMKSNPTMARIAMLVGGILLALAIGAVIYFSHRLRKLCGLEWLLDHSKVPSFIKHADDSLHVYHNHFNVLLWAFMASLVTQFMAPLSAWMAGRAFGVQGASLGHYFAFVPIALLAASMPVAPPQGFGVTEYILYHFFCEKPLQMSGHPLASAGQTFAIAQAVRFLPVMWNLVGAYWVVRGNYSRAAMQKESAEEDAREGAAGSETEPAAA